MSTSVLTSLSTTAATSPKITVTSTADSGPGSLRAAIAAAAPGSTIQFAASLKDKTITLNSELQIPPGKNLVIDGAAAANLTISGNQRSRIFWVNSNQDRPISLTLKNLKLANAYTKDQGGAIKGEHKAKITVENVKFVNNVADKGGGAIYCAWENSLSVKGSLFDGNKAIAGNDERGAGAIAFVSPGSITVRNSTFSNNRGINGAAINSLNGLLTVDGCKFINNDTKEARYATGQPNAFLRGYGGAIYTDRSNNAITIKNSTFENNVGKASGGAVHLFADPEDTVTIENTLFRGNQAIGLAGGQDKGKGGAITQIRNSLNSQGSFTMRNVTVANNTGYDQGGGLWVNNTRTSIVNSTFSGNQLKGSTGSNVGGAMTLYSDTNIVNTTIANNYAGWVGGGICADSKAAVSVQNTIFYKNTAANGTNNWGIEQHTNRELTDKGGNIQYPPKKTNNWNDYNATSKVKLVDPKLGPLQNNGGPVPTHALLGGSPAINGGVSAGAPLTDARNFTRDRQVDAGAFEFGAKAATVRALNASDNLSGNDWIKGTAKKDVLLAGAGDDVLVGDQGADTLTGGSGADRFLYSGKSQRLAYSHSRLNALDRITDFHAGQKDKIQLDTDRDLTTIDRPTGLFNAGSVKGRTLTDAVKSAYKDKDRQQKGKQSLAANEAVFFNWQKQTYLAVNDQQQAFSRKSDLLINMTGIQMQGDDATAGVLSVKNYFG